MDIVITQGTTFQKVIRWEAGPIVYKQISSMSSSAPCSIVAASHGVPDGWRVAITSAKGLTKLNAKTKTPKADEYYKATYVDGNTIELNSVNTQGESSYTGGGVLQYNTPVSLDGCVARMQVRYSIEDADPAIDIDSDLLGGIVVDDSAKTISISIPATDTAALTPGRGVYSVEIEDAGGVVTTLAKGNVKIVREATR
jgi:hypothetical protein